MRTTLSDQEVELIIFFECHVLMPRALSGYDNFHVSFPIQGWWFSPGTLKLPLPTKTGCHEKW